MHVPGDAMFCYVCCVLQTDHLITYALAEWLAVDWLTSDWVTPELELYSLSLVELSVGEGNLSLLPVRGLKNVGADNSDTVESSG